MIVVCIILFILLCMAITTCIILFYLLQMTNENFSGLQHVFFVMRKWDRREEQQNDYIKNRLMSAGYKRVAIYGCTVIGKRIVRELKKSDIEAVCFIDRNAANLQADIQIIPNVDNLLDVDAIIITVVTQYYVIKDSLCDKVNCPVLLIEDLL